MQSYSSKSSCPNRCPFKGSGCYAEGKLYKFKKGGAMDLIGQASMHGSVMNATLSMWNNHIKEIENNA